MPEIGDGLWIKIGLDTTQLEQGLTKTKASLTEWRDETNANTRDLAKWGQAIGAATAPLLAFGAAAVVAIEKYGAMADNINDLALSLDVSTDKIQHFQKAAVLSGTDMGTVSQSLGKLSISMGEFDNKTSAAAKAFERLGIDPSGRGMDEVFDETALALYRMEDTTQRNAIAMDLYGKSWKDMLPYIETYVEKQDEIQSSPTMSREELQNLEDAKIAWDNLGQSAFMATGKILAFVENSFSQETMAKLGRMATAYKKLLIDHDVKGFFDDAAAYHDDQARAEAAKITAQAAQNGAGTGGNRGGTGAGTGTGTAANGNGWKGEGGLNTLLDLWPKSQAEFASYDSYTQSMLIGAGYNPYSENGTSSGGWQSSSTYLGPGVGDLAPLYSMLKGASGVSSSVMGAMGDYETAIAAWRTNQGNSVNTGMYVGGSFGSGEGGAGSTDINGMLYSNIKKWQALFTAELTRVAAAELKKRQEYTIAFTQNIQGVLDPLAVASATSRALAAELNKAGVT
jgi:hypothetical protein